MSQVARVETLSQPPAIAAESVTVLQIIQQVAMSPNADIDKMERLIVMHQNIQALQAKQQFDEALAAMQEELPVIGEAFGVRSFSRRSWCKSTSRVMDRELFVGVSPALQIAMYAYEALLTKLTQARREYVSQVRAGKQRSSYSPETAGDHFALAWVSAVHDKIHERVPRGEEDLAIGQHSNGRELVAVEAKDKALIEQYLSGRAIGKARKAREVELDLDAQIAGLLAGQRVELNPGLATGGQEALQIGMT